MIALYLTIMWVVSIVSIQTDQSRPDQTHLFGLIGDIQVSIVSIQTDQSRHVVTPELVGFEDGFQSYQSKQINPDADEKAENAVLKQKFQSYQSKQINPDYAHYIDEYSLMYGFNRINPNRSIPTRTKARCAWALQ